jgi:hypothetical protein
MIRVFLKNLQGSVNLYSLQSMHQESVRRMLYYHSILYCSIGIVCHLTFLNQSMLDKDVECKQGAIIIICSILFFKFTNRKLTPCY